MQFSSDIVKVSPSDEALGWWSLNFQCVCFFPQVFCGVILFLSNCLLILWTFVSQLKPFIAWWGCPVACVFLFVSQAFLEEVWNKTQIENVSIFIIYLMCKQLYWKLFVSTPYVTFQENKLEGVSLKTLYICHI